MPQAGAVRWERCGRPPGSPTAGTGGPSPAPRPRRPSVALRLPDFIFSLPTPGGPTQAPAPRAGGDGHRPARDPHRTEALPRGRERGSPAPAPGALSGERWVSWPCWTHRRLRGAGFPPLNTPPDGSGRGAPRSRPPPSTGAPKPSGTRKLRRELYPEKGFFFFFFFCKLPSLRRGVDILPRLL